MAYQDHLTRQVGQLGMVLRRLLSDALGLDDRAVQFMEMDAIELALNEALDLRSESLTNMAPEMLLGELQHLGAATEANQDLLADLLIALADRTIDATRRKQLLRQALAILEHLNATGDTFNMERHGKAGRLRALV
ncbi:MAG: hypothetical protein IPO05_17055 [Flavobacteriales bacterium]|nr:hypothetical protein [Flavobacteriales bacterium]